MVVDSFYTANILIPSEKTIIEINGPIDFNGLNKMKKRTLTKHRVFRQLGYKVKGITAKSFYEKQRKNKGSEYVKSCLFDTNQMENEFETKDREGKKDEYDEQTSEIHQKESESKQEASALLEAYEIANANLNHSQPDARVL